jgi:ubiquinone/menaquinone biosynthesis C-methylase UbiE
MGDLIGKLDTGYLQLIAQLLEHAKMSSYQLMDLQEGSRVLDVGCGPGTDTIRLASLTGPMGIVIGIDRDPEMVAEADKRAKEAGVETWVEHTEGDAAALPFEDGVFSACRSERLFQHLPEPLPALVLSEMVRVTEAGGRVVLLDTDYATESVYTSETEIERRLARVMPERLLSNGYIARALPKLFDEAGLVDIDVEVHPLLIRSYDTFRRMSLADRREAEALKAGIVTSDDLQRWHSSLEAADKQGAFMAQGNMVLVAGRKP